MDNHNTGYSEFSHANPLGGGGQMGGGVCNYVSTCVGGCGMCGCLQPVADLKDPREGGEWSLEGGKGGGLSVHSNKVNIFLLWVVGSGFVIRVGYRPFFLVRGGSRLTTQVVPRRTILITQLFIFIKCRASPQGQGGGGGARGPWTGSRDMNMLMQQIFKHSKIKLWFNWQKGNTLFIIRSTWINLAKIYDLERPEKKQMSFI